MNDFEFWQGWGLELDDGEFANALLVLGVLATLPFSKSEFIPGKDLQELLLTTLKLSQEKDKLLPWRFPKRNQHAKIHNNTVFLSNLNPNQVANAWKGIGDGTTTAPRIQVLSYPVTEGVSTWFRMLFEANPPVRAAHIVFDSAQARPHLKWPLRIGYLSGNNGEAIIKSISTKWPSDKLTRPVKIDRDNANCDVMVFIGSGRQLLRELLDVPGRQKSNLVIVRDRIENDMASVKQRLAALSSESSASGYVFLRPDIPDEVLSDALNRFIENLSHNQPMDVALSEAFTQRQKTDPTIFLSRHLATFQIDRMMENIHTRLLALPKSARPEIKPDMLDRVGVTVDVGKGDLTDPVYVAKKLSKYKSAICYDSESSGALSMAEMNSAIEDAERTVTEEKQHQRFLQEQVLIKKQGKYVEERRAFQRGIPMLIRVRVGPPDEKWTAIDSGFPEEKLPKDREEWRLSIVLTEPNHLKEPLIRSVKLPKSGPSKECKFRIQPGEHTLFEGRITVLHRGRVLQTGVLKGRVVAGERDILTDDTIAFADILSVRSHIGDLEGRRQFDLAFVVNHSADNRPRLQAIVANHAWIADLSTCKSVAADINSALTKVTKSVRDYSGGLESDNSRKLLVELAQLGRYLYGFIVEDQLEAPTNRSEIAKKEYVQIVSTRVEALVPFEFIYDFETPHDDALLCSTWRESLTKGACTETCDTKSGKIVCPLGFWGVSKVIERHALTTEFAAEGKEVFLQSEPTRGRDVLPLWGTAIVAASVIVKPSMLGPVLSACAERLGSPPQEAKDWKQWAELVRDFKPHVLIALPHTDGNGFKATLEIGGMSIKSIEIEKGYVRAEGDDTYPLVVLLGCDTTGTALEYGSPVADFRRKGAAVVIGTIAMVLGEHATKVAEMLVNGLAQDSEKLERLGEVIRSVKRKALLEGLLMALCVVAFGDADWKLAGKESYNA
jgi:hypothetical protein